ncbi:MAG: AI-2E family transporter, partial [Candidatus Saccharimonas aalborgensis]
TLLLLINSVPAAVIFAIYFLIYSQIEGNFIAPTIQSRRIELSPLAILAAVTIGIYVFGITGAIISIPVAGCIKVLVEDYLERSRDHQKQQQKPLVKLAKKLSGGED